MVKGPDKIPSSGQANTSKTTVNSGKQPEQVQKNLADTLQKGLSGAGKAKLDSAQVQAMVKQGSSAKAKSIFDDPATKAMVDAELKKLEEVMAKAKEEKEKFPNLFK